VSLEVQRFQSAPGSYALLDASTPCDARRTADRRPAARPPAKPPADKSYDALAAAHSRAVARLAADIAAATRSLAAQAPRPAAANR
jgi:uncharacterized lipoprotein YmbA